MAVADDFALCSHVPRKSLPRCLNVVRRLPRLKHMPRILHDILCLCRARWMSYNKLKGVQLKNDRWANRISDLEAKNSC